MRSFLRPVYTLLIFGTVLFKPLAAQQGSTAAQFLKIGVDAGAAGMGEAAVASASDVSALFWNPAGLAHISRMSILISHTSWIADLSHDFIGITVPLGNQTIGASLTSLNMGETEITTLEQPQGTGSFYDASDFALGISYARRMTDRLSVGVSAKYIRQAIVNEVATGISFDVGTSLDVGIGGLRIAMALTNYGTGMQLQGDDIVIPYYPGPASTPIKANIETSTFPMPTNFRTGISFEVIGQQSFFLSSESSTMILAVDGNHPIDAVERGNVGVEYTWNHMIALRTGYKYNYPEQGLSYGGSVEMESGSSLVTIDYALSKFGVLGNVHRFTIQLGI